MPELWFYHLERETAESLLPQLLRRGLERGLRLSVQTISPERAKSWSNALWAYEDTGFLPHGLEGDSRTSEQPIWVTEGNSNPNGSTFRFYVDGAIPLLDWLLQETSIERASLLFEGSSEASVVAARELWEQSQGSGINVRYQRQNEVGNWTEVTAGVT